MAKNKNPERNEDMASNGEAVGLLETRGLVCHLVATDAMCKAAEVQVISQVQIGGAYITTLIRGDVGSVRAAVDAGAQVASKTGELITAHIIARPERAIIDLFAK
jgi:ethanolamine utilization protein EutM